MRFLYPLSSIYTHTHTSTTANWIISKAFYMFPTNELSINMAQTHNTSYYNIVKTIARVLLSRAFFFPVFHCSSLYLNTWNKRHNIAASVVSAMLLKYTILDMRYHDIHTGQSYSTVRLFYWVSPILKFNRIAPSPSCYRSACANTRTISRTHCTLCNLIEHQQIDLWIEYWKNRVLWFIF